MPDTQRAAYAAVLRAIADAAETTGIPVPHGYLTTFPENLAQAAAFVRAVPLTWTGRPPAPGESFYTFQGDLGGYNRDGIRVYVHVRAEDAGTATGPEPVMTAGWEPLPEIAALLEPAPLPAYAEPPGIAHCGPGACTCGARVDAAGNVTPAEPVLLMDRS
jgi:hypothetical protein